MTNEFSNLCKNIEAVAAGLGLKISRKDELFTVSDGKMEHDFRVDPRGKGIYWTEDRLSSKIDMASIRTRLRTISRKLHESRLQHDEEAEQNARINELVHTVGTAVPGNYSLGTVYIKTNGNFGAELFVMGHPVIRSRVHLEFRGIQHAIDTMRALLAIQ